MADVKIVDIDTYQWNIKDQVARDKIAELETSISNDNTYSTEEIKTSKKWIDGKPIYRKVINLGNLPNATYKNVPTNISNLETIVSLLGFAKSQDNSEQHSILSPSVGGNIYVIDIYYENGNLILSTGFDRSGLVGFVILEYTKTSD